MKNLLFSFLILLPVICFTLSKEKPHLLDNLEKADLL
jgi:hypothetical protein